MTESDSVVRLEKVSKAYTDGQTFYALNEIDDTLLLLEICRREAIDAVALEQVRDDLALVLRRAVDASR